MDGTYKKKPCVWKIEHITKKDQENKKSAMWNELQFSLDFANKHHLGLSFGEIKR